MKNSKIPYIRWLPLILIGIIFYKSLNSLDAIKSFVNLVISVLVPLIWAMVIAYIVHPAVKRLESLPRINRTYSIAIVYLVLLGLIITLGVVVVPRLVLNITELVNRLPQLIVTLETFLADSIASLKNYSFSQYIDFTAVDEYISHISGIFDTFITTLLDSVLGFGSGVFKFFMGLIISIYILKDKEAFGRGIKRFMYASFSKETTTYLLELFRDSDRIFSSYIIGKLLDSVIVGVIAFLGFNVLGTPYTLLLAMIIGVTNMIPYFGPFIGAVPVTIIILFFDPILAVWSVLFIFILQQLDGYVIGPKILGQSMGMSPFWIILAILIGGGLFGLLGMLVGVPVMAIVRNVAIKSINHKLDEKEITVT